MFISSQTRHSVASPWGTRSYLVDMASFEASARWSTPLVVYVIDLLKSETLYQSVWVDEKPARKEIPTGNKKRLTKRKQTAAETGNGVITAEHTCSGVRRSIIFSTTSLCYGMYGETPHLIRYLLFVSEWRSDLKELWVKLCCQGSSPNCRSTRLSSTFKSLHIWDYVNPREHNPPLLGMMIPLILLYEWRLNLKS